MSDIFQQIWSADMNGSGVPAIRPGESKDAAVGYVVVDEQASQVGTDHKVLAEVVIPESKLQTYRLCERIFDNYALERAATEVIRAAETQEELDLIDAILPTPPIQVARAYIEQILSLSISDSTLAAMIRETWFDFGNAGSQRDASGFEHVFVGEQASKRTKVGGYHFWYKYYLDDGGRTVSLGGDIGDGVDRMEYRGTKYGGAQEPAKGILVPEVVTLSLVWNAPAGDGGAATTLDKPIGGFFVGLSPEGLIAMGLVRARTPSGKIASINGAEYQLDLHRLDGSPNAIRTFFPRFLKADVEAIHVPSEPTDGTGPTDSGGVPTPSTGPNQIGGQFRMVAGMVNPANPEGGREFLQLINTDAARATLKGWRIVAPNGTSFTLSDIAVEPGAIFKFVLPTSQGILRNKGGDIALISPTGDTVQVCSYDSGDTAIEGKPILFLNS